jgi:hypothetical protein
MAASCRPNPTPERVVAYQAAVTRFEHDSAKWVRDSLVRDSISRTINTDSLYHLYHVMLLATEPVPIMSLLHCEKCRLGWKYGIEPTLAAEARMYDTLFTPAEHKMAHEKDDQLVITPAQQMTLGVGPKRCGPLGPLRPDTADGRCSEQSIRSRCDRERPDVGRRRLRRRWCGRCYRIEI